MKNNYFLSLFFLTLIAGFGKNGLSQGSATNPIQPSIGGINNTVCLSATIYELVGTPSGGVFSGDGIVNGNQFNPIEAGVAVHTISYTVQGIAGPISTSIEVEVVSEIVINVDSALCEGQVYTVPDGTEFTAPGVYDYAIIEPNGCTTRYNLNLEQNPNLPITINAVLCGNEGYNLPGVGMVFPDQSTTYDYQLPPASPGGCPINYLITLNPYPEAQDQVLSILRCVGDLVELPNGQSISQSGVYTGTANDENGCPFDFAYTVEFTPEFSDIIGVITICEGETYTLPNGQVVSLPGNYEGGFGFGDCSGFFDIDLVFAPNNQVFSELFICQGESITFPDGNTITPLVNQNYEYTLPSGNPQECPTSFFVDIFVYPAAEDQVLSLSGCVGDLIELPNGQSVSQPGVYSGTATNENGCPFDFTYTIEFTPIFDNIDNDVRICEGETYTLPNGQVVETGGVYFGNYGFGYCSGTFEIFLVVNIPSVAFEGVSICRGSTVTLPTGESVSPTVTTTYVFTRNVDGEDCPQVVNYTVEILSVQEDITISEEICEGESYLLPNGETVTEAGIYPVTLLEESGCPYTITTQLTVFPVPPRISLSLTLCENESYTLPNGVTVNEANTYEGTYVPAGGNPNCPGSFIISISYEAPVFNSFTLDICRGESVLLPNGVTVIPTAETRYVGELPNPNGNCPIQWVREIVFKFSLPDDSVYVNICEGDSYLLPDGSEVSAAGEYVNTFITEDDCPYTITTFIQVWPLTASRNEFICPGESFTFPNGTSTSEAGVFVIPVENASACITQTTFTIDFFDVNNEVVNVQICPGGAYDLADGTVVNQPGTYSTSVPDFQTGCTRTITVNLSFFTLPETTIREVTICEGEQYELRPGQFITEAGDYTIPRESVDNCGYFDIVRLIVIPTQTQTITAILPNNGSYTLPDGTVVTAPGTYTSSIIGETGCGLNITTILNPEETNPSCHAVAVFDFQPGLTKAGAVIQETRQDETQAIGEPQSVQNGVVNFVSLGFGGQITLDFGGPIDNGEGADIEVFEATWNSETCQSYPEKAEVFVSQNGCDFVYAGVVCTNGGSVDISPLSWAQYVRLVDVSNPSDFDDSNADGFDVNAVACLNGAGIIADDGLQAGSLQEIVAYQPGLRKNNTPVLEPRRQTDKALGTTLSVGQQIEFVSLGFGGSLIGKFDYVVFARNAGPELQVVETSFGNPACNRYPESARFFVSQLGGSDWVELPGLCQDGTLEIGHLDWFQYLKVVDNSPIASTRFNGAADGYDVDAVLTLGTCGQAARIGQFEEPETIAQADEVGEIRLFPNPVASLIHIDFQGVEVDQPVQYELMDMQGRLIQSGKINSPASGGPSVLSAEMLAPGVYTLRLMNEQLDTVLKFVK